MLAVERLCQRNVSRSSRSAISQRGVPPMAPAQRVGVLARVPQWLAARGRGPGHLAAGGWMAVGEPQFAIGAATTGSQEGVHIKVRCGSTTCQASSTLVSGSNTAVTAAAPPVLLSLQVCHSSGAGHWTQWPPFAATIPLYCQRSLMDAQLQLACAKLLQPMILARWGSCAPCAACRAPFTERPTTADYTRQVQTVCLYNESIVMQVCRQAGSCLPFSRSKQSSVGAVQLRGHDLDPFSSPGFATQAARFALALGNRLHIARSRVSRRQPRSSCGSIAGYNSGEPLIASRSRPDLNNGAGNAGGAPGDGPGATSGWRGQPVRVVIVSDPC